MMKRLSLLGSLYVLMALAITPFTLAPQTAEAQFAPTTDNSVNVAWSLNPRDFPDLYPRVEGGGIGSGRVITDIDSDGDGNMEFLFTTDETLAPGGPDPGFLDVFLYENNGDNSYEYVWSYTLTEASNSLPGLAYGDVDDDGLFEIYFGVPTLPSGGNPADLFIFEQNADLTFPDEPTVSYGYERDAALDFRPAGIQIVDADGDGQKEILTVSRTSGARELVIISPVAGLHAFATFTIEFEASEDLLGGGGLYDVTVVDYDGDGMMEIWASTWDLLSMTIFEATRPNTYELQVDINDATPDVDHGSHNAHDLNFVDIDGDGKMEFIWPTTNAHLFLLEDTDDVSTLSGADFIDVGYFVPADHATGPADDRGRGSDIGDLDGDGLLDIILSGYTNERIYRAEYQGTGSIADSTSYEWSVILNSSSDADQERYYPLHITNDLDGDGLNEIVITNRAASAPGQPLILILESTGVTIDVENPDTPSDFVLDRNYPNPFTTATTIEYALDHTNAVTVRVFDMMGREVRTLVASKTQLAGRHEVAWDGRNAAGARVASGTYLYTLEVNGIVQSRVMTLLK